MSGQSGFVKGVARSEGISIGSGSVQVIGDQLSSAPDLSRCTCRRERLLSRRRVDQLSARLLNETQRPIQSAVFRTRLVPRQYPAPLRDGFEFRNSTGKPLKSRLHFGPRALIVGVRFHVGQSSIKQRSFSVSHWNIFRRERIPNRADQVQPICRAQACDFGKERFIDYWLKDNARIN